MLDIGVSYHLLHVRVILINLDPGQYMQRSESFHPSERSPEHLGFLVLLDRTSFVNWFAILFEGHDKVMLEY
jgi:hypothetical protein